MKQTINIFWLGVLMTGLGLIQADRVIAQNFTTLHTFTAGSDGANPYAALIISGNTLFGTALYGGYGQGDGTVFRVNTDGTCFTTLHIFTGGNNGANPYAGLTLSGNTLYGTANQGGNSGYGVVFAVNTDGSGYTNLYSFTGGSDGANPQGCLVLAGGTLYGTSEGGSSGYGTVFKINTDGTGFMRLHGFNDTSDGGWPQAGLILSNNTLYGTALVGGGLGANPYGAGTVFKVNTDGTGFTPLHRFTGGSDGLNPYAPLLLSGNTLYGTTFYGGSSIAGATGYGTVFAVNTDGTGFTNLYNFTGGSDGANPEAGLILSGSTLYGTTRNRGNMGYGTVFQVDNNGSSFTTLHYFNAINEGAWPYAGLVLSGNILFGSAYAAGGGDGAIFSLLLASPQLAITPSGTNVILSWPASTAGFNLQSTTNLLPSAVWMPVTPSPVVLTTNNVVTNNLTGAQQFYRLSQ